MDTFFTIFKKVVIGMMFVVFGATMVYVPQDFTPRAEASVAGFGGSTEFTQILNNIQLLAVNIADSATSFFSNLLNMKEFALDGIAWAIAKQVVSSMVSSLIDWINSGFQGSPAFVQDLGDFLLQAADEAFGQFIQEVAPFVCSPFRLDVQIAVAVSYDRSRTNEPPTCTLSGVFENFEAFIDGEFGQGGWNDWFKITSNPSVYTEYGSVLSVDTKARARVVNAKGEEINILGFGDGFLSGKICEDVDGPAGQSELCAIAKPGKMIVDALGKSLGSGQDALITADEIDEIIAALLGQLANTAITGAAGLLGLSGGTGYTYRGYSRGSFAQELIDGTPADEAGGVGDASGSNGTVNTGDISFATDYIQSTLANQQSALTRVNNYIVELQNAANNPLNNQQVRVQAQVALNEAQMYKSRMELGIQTAAPMVNEYITLENEYANADTERRIQIRNEQSDIIQEFNAVGLVSDVEFNSVFTRWDTILSQDVTPACVASFVDADGDGNLDFWDADCDGNPDQFIVDVGAGEGDCRVGTLCN